MVNYPPALNATFAALADPTRRAILARLALGESSVTELAQPFAMSLPAVLKHLDRLEEAGLVSARKEGRVRRCRLETAPFAEAADWIGRQRRLWEGRFDALDRYLRETEEEDPCPQPTAPRSRFASPVSSRRRAKGSSAPGRSRRR